MKTIPYSRIVETVRDLCLQAAFELPADVGNALKKAQRAEKSATGKALIGRCITNFSVAKETKIPICQDTGIAVFFVELGDAVKIKGGTLPRAINEGVGRGYTEGYLRPSMVSDPLYDRKNTFTNTPAIIHMEIVEGDSLSITLAPKGGGSENMTTLCMLKPAEGEAGVISAVVNTILKAGGNPCPPVIVGIGIGGTAEHAVKMSKKALVRHVGTANKNKKFSVLEKKLLTKVNESGVGPGGLGGSVTALAVHIETCACHIATMPVAISLSCHVARHATVIL